MSTLWLTRLVALCGVTLGAAIMLWPPEILQPNMAKPAGLVLATLALLSTAVVPEYVVALFFFTLASLLTVGPADVVFSGFHAAALWLVVGGLIIGVGVKRSGLAERVAAYIAARFGSRYSAILAGTASVGLALAFVMPSTLSRVLLLMPIVLAMADRFGFTPGRPGRTAMVLAMTTTSMLPAFAILPATVPGVIVSGAAESVFGVNLTYGAYLAQNFPALGFVKAVLIVGFIAWQFPDTPNAAELPTPVDPMRRTERLMALLLSGALFLWATDFWHQISPAWIALATALVLIFPGVGLVSQESFAKDINFGSVFYVGAMIGMGGLISHSGLGTLLAEILLSRLPLQEGDVALNFASITALGIALGAVATQPGVPLVMMPLTDALHGMTGISFEGLLAMQIAAFSTALLPYQMPPLVVAWAVGGVRMRDGSKVVLFIFAASLVLLLPLHYAWLRWIGIL